MAIKKPFPCLWFDSQAEEAARFYTSIFKNSKVSAITRYPEAATEASGKPAGSVLTVSFELDGQEFMALNGGPEFRFSEAVSLVVQCDTQEEIDTLWEKLLEGGGEESMCGWLKDRFGLSWQITPAELDEMLLDPNPAKVNAATAAFMPMRKLDIATIRKAYEAAA